MSRISNSFSLIGNLTHEPEIRTSQSGTQVCNFTVAYNNGRKDAEGNTHTDFFNCTAFNKNAEFIQKYFHKGSKIGIQGTLGVRQYQSTKYADNTGTPANLTQVTLTVDAVDFVGSKADNQASAQGNYQQSNAPAQRPAQNGYNRAPVAPVDTADELPF